LKILDIAKKGSLVHTIIADTCSAPYNRFMHATDCHFHVFAAHAAVPGARYSPDYAASLAQWECAAGGAGVTRGVVVQPSFLGEDHTQLLAALAGEPDALRGVAVVGAEVSVQALAGLRAAGVRGVRLNLVGAADDVGALRALPSQWWGALASADLHVELHTQIGRVAALVPHIPREITLVLDHFAKPERARADDPTLRAVAARSGNTWVKLSAAYRQAPGIAPGVLTRCWLDTLGPSALVWGSDWPCTNFEYLRDYAALCAERDGWLPNMEIRAQILSDNALRLYWR
jgi:predicted TIM-barrel fold metal-dependent hydrolase